MRRPYVAAVLFVAALMAVVAATVWWLGRPVNRFAPGFNERAFRALPRGTAVVDVIDRVGKPFGFTVEGAGGAKTGWGWHDFVSTERLLRQCEAGGRVQLVYSWRGKRGRYFEVYVVHLEDGKVEGIGVYPGN